MCVAHDAVDVERTHTFHILMLLSWSPVHGSGTPREFPANARKRSTIRDAKEKTWIPHGYEVRQLHSVECADSQGFEARVAGLSGVRGWRQSRHELVWRHEASSDARRHTELKDQVQELGSRDVNLDAAIDFMATIRCQCSTGTQKSSTPIPTEMRLKDQSAAIILVEDLTWAHSDANSWDIQTSAHVVGRTRSRTRQEATAQQVLRRARRPARQECQLASGPLRAVGF